MAKKIDYLEGIIPSGTAATCGDGKSCGYAVGIKRNHPEISRLKVGWQTLTFHYRGDKYVVPTPMHMVENLREFDRTAVDGACVILTSDWQYRIPLGGKNVVKTPIQSMTESDKERLNTRRAEQGRTREQLDHENRLARISNARIKARLS